MLVLALDGVASMSAAPLRIAYLLSLLFFAAFAGYVLYVLYEHLVRGGELVHGWTSLMAAITVFGTLQLLELGILGEYLGRIYEQSKNRPLFIVQDIVRSGSDLQPSCFNS
jgi:dolichol-phosphate mannosyltransferase